MEMVLPVGLAAALWLLVIALARPRLLAYVIFALTPTQFIFVPVSNFFVSPADVLVTAAGAGLALRLAAGNPRALAALWLHRYVGLMVLAYAVGFALHDAYSRTLVRVVLGVIPAVLACELLLTRLQIRRAATALVVAGVADAGYGLYMYATGSPLHPTRFSGMAGVNFSAMVIITAAAIALAQRARALGWLRLVNPGALIALGLATMSQMGVIALLTGGVVVIRRVMTPRNVARVLFVAGLCLVAALASNTVRDRIAARNERAVGLDGVARNSADIRRLILGVAWDGFTENPIFGIGYSTFLEYSLRDPEIRASTAGHGYYTHNTYVEIVVEGGLLALAFFMLHAWQYVATLGPALRDLARWKDTVAASALVGLPIIAVVASLADVLVHYHFWSVAGIGLAYLRLHRREGRLGIDPLTDTAAVPPPAEPPDSLAR